MSKDAYTISLTTLDELSEAERTRCETLINAGGAIKRENISKWRTLADTLAAARLGDEIAGLGAIKIIRADYARTVMKESGVEFDPYTTRELGYVTIDPAHGGHKLATRLTGLLLTTHDGGFYATTDNPAMKHILDAFGFAQQGREWDGARGTLSLWIRETAAKG